MKSPLASLRIKAPRILKRDFSPFFPMQLMAKDMRLVLETTASLDVDLRLATTLGSIFAACLADGLGDEDFAATIKSLEKCAGSEVRSTRPGV